MFAMLALDSKHPVMCVTVLFHPLLSLSLFLFLSLSLLLLIHTHTPDLLIIINLSGCMKPTNTAIQLHQHLHNGNFSFFEGYVQEYGHILYNDFRRLDHLIMSSHAVGAKEQNDLDNSNNSPSSHPLPSTFLYPYPLPLYPYPLPLYP